MNMKSYGNHNAAYDARILSIRPQYVIDNPPHGLYGEMESPQYTASWLLQNVAGYQAAGIKVIGYITSGYEGKGGDDGYATKWYSLDMQKKLITNMATIDHVDGVFIDECSEQPGTASKTYLKALTDLAHSYGLITWGNTGVDQFDEWFFTEGGFDYMQSSESWRGQALSSVQKKWGSRISVTGFNSSYTANDALRLTLDAWNKGLAYCYINTVEYVAIAPWFEQYAQMLRDNGGTVSPDQPVTPAVNSPPVLASIGNKTVQVNSQLSFTISATDPNGDTLTYSTSSLPSGATFSSATRTFNWTPTTASTYQVTFTVTDGSLTDSETINITVTAPPDSTPAATTTKIVKRVRASADDGFISGSWGYRKAALWYEAGNPGSPYGSWFRFTDVTIPKGAIILSATLMTIHGKWSPGTHLIVRAEKKVKPLSPASVADYNGRVRTSASVDWVSGYGDWSWHNSPDFATVIQELVNSFDYSSGGNIQIFVDNAGSTRGSEHVGSTIEDGYAPRLIIEYK